MLESIAWAIRKVKKPTRYFLVTRVEEDNSACVGIEMHDDILQEATHNVSTCCDRPRTYEWH